MWRHTGLTVTPHIEQDVGGIGSLSGESLRLFPTNDFDLLFAVRGVWICYSYTIRYISLVTGKCATN